MAISRRTGFGGAPGSVGNITGSAGNTSVNMVPATGGDPVSGFYNPAYTSGYTSWKWGGVEQLNFSRVTTYDQNVINVEVPNGSLFFDLAGANAVITFRTQDTNGTVEWFTNNLFFFDSDFNTALEYESHTGGTDHWTFNAQSSTVGYNYQWASATKYSLSFTGTTLTQTTTGSLVVKATDGTLADSSGNPIVRWNANNVIYSKPMIGSTAETKPLCEGYQAKTWPSDANYTATSSEYINPFWVLSGGSLTATRNLVMPLVAGARFWVSNGTSGAHSIQVIGATGTGITIATGKAAWVLCDGTNYLRMTADV